MTRLTASAVVTDDQRSSADLKDIRLTAPPGVNVTFCLFVTYGCKLNTIASIVTIFFLLVYAAVDLACLALEWGLRSQLQPIELSESAEATEPTALTELSQPTVATAPTKLLEVMVLTKPTAPTKLMEATAPMKAMELAEATEPTAATEPSAPTKPTAVTALTELFETMEATAVTAPPEATEATARSHILTQASG
ncbi:hypothetical protein AOLI_G00325430 [Acnodon oligacanthus]